MAPHHVRGKPTLLKDRTAVVTGGSRGIGFQIAKIFIEQGARVLAVSRSADKLAGAKAALPSLETIAADAAAPDQIDSLVAWVQERCGSLDILVNNAGIMDTDEADLTTGEDSAFVDTVHTNLFVPTSARSDSYRSCCKAQTRVSSTLGHARGSSRQTSGARMAYPRSACMG